MMEDAATIRKAMVQTGELSTKVASGDAQSLNQSCRWISTKDEHANKIISTTAEYFLAQRVVVRFSPALDQASCCYVIYHLSNDA
jgi:nickel superoxide dismutase